jgi:hypothetical protein
MFKKTMLIKYRTDNLEHIYYIIHNILNTQK